MGGWLAALLLITGQSGLDDLLGELQGTGGGGGMVGGGGGGEGW